MTAPAASPLDPTFRTYDPTAAAAYAVSRPPYASPLLSEILSYHTSRPVASSVSSPSVTPASWNTVIDLGCGPGNSTRDLALPSQHAIGVDPSPAMIETARMKGGVTETGEDVRWVIGEAGTPETLLEERGHGVDMITARMAVSSGTRRRSEEAIGVIISLACLGSLVPHASFWAQASVALKDNGTIALWSNSSLRFRVSWFLSPS